MKITGSSVEQNAQSSHVFEQQQSFAADETQNQPLRMTASNGIRIEFSEMASQRVSGPFYQLSEEDDFKLQLLERLISALTGKKFRFQQAYKRPPNMQSSQIQLDLSSAMQLSIGGIVGRNSGNGGVIGTRTTMVYEYEQMQYQSKGTVETADGRSIEFNLNLNMSRETYSKTVEEGILFDPLVINFDGKGAAFGDDSIEIDLNLDGAVDTFKMLNQGSGFLALDKNNNGVVDDGSELFGPETGSGFGELAAYDEDGNGWIDESDEVFDQLKIWTVSPEGVKTLIGLKEAGVGAIYLASVQSRYQMKSDGELNGAIRSTGTYLRENGTAGAVHEIDVKI